MPTSVLSASLLGSYGCSLTWQPEVSRQPSNLASHCVISLWKGSYSHRGSDFFIWIMGSED